MKTMIGATVDVGVRDALKERAYKERKSFSALVNEILTLAAGASSPTPTPPKLSKKAQIVLEGVKALHNLADRLSEDDIRFHAREYRMDEICKKVGLFPSSALPALRECERVGVLLVSKVPPIGMTEDALWVDHWRLPKVQK